MKLHDLKSPEGSIKRKKIVGRGIGGRGGKTAGTGRPKCQLFLTKRALPRHKMAERGP